jgi:SWIM zinc finger
MAPATAAEVLESVGESLGGSQSRALLAAQAAARRIETIGGDGRAIWGRVRGGASYQTAVDLAGPGFTCTCPSARAPCKHALALLLAASAGPVSGAPPEWVTEWLAARDEKARRRAERAARGETVADPAAQARRLSEREARVAVGLDELERWLGDLVGRGLASVAEAGYALFEAPAARLVDAQARGLAGRVRALAGPALSGKPDGPARLLEKLGLLHLLVQAYRRQESLPPDVRADVRALAGWSVPQEDLLRGEGVRDRWAVLGWRIEEDERYRTQRVWARGVASGRWALLLSFAPAAAPIDRSFSPGTVVDAELVFFPGAVPLRALVKARHAVTPPSLAELPRALPLDPALAEWGAAVARNPWIEEYPLTLSDLVPVPPAAGAGSGWTLRDGEGRAVPIDPRFSSVWPLAAVSGGRPIAVFGEWNAHELLPLAAVAEGRYVSW